MSGMSQTFIYHSDKLQAGFPLKWILLLHNHKKHDASVNSNPLLHHGLI